MRWSRARPKPCAHALLPWQSQGGPVVSRAVPAQAQALSSKERPHRSVQVVYLQIYQHLVFFFSRCFHFLLLWEEAEGEWEAGVVMWKR